MELSILGLLPDLDGGEVGVFEVLVVVLASLLGVNIEEGGDVDHVALEGPDMMKYHFTHFWIISVEKRFGLPQMPQLIGEYLFDMEVIISPWLC